MFFLIQNTQLEIHLLQFVTLLCCVSLDGFFNPSCISLSPCPQLWHSSSLTHFFLLTYSVIVVNLSSVGSDPFLYSLLNTSSGEQRTNSSRWRSPTKHWRGWN